MERLISHIEYLLDRHDCVIIPGIGGFIKTHKPASIDPSIGLVKAPQRVISFNGDLTHDDGLLASSYARATGITYSVAVNQLASDTSILKTQLAANNTIELGSIGTLSLQSDNKLLFTNSESYYTNLGLRDITLDTTLTQTINNDNTLNVIKPYSTDTHSHPLHSFMKYVAMVVLLFTLGIILSTPVINNDEVTRASLIPTDYVTNTNSDLNDKIPELLLAQPNDTMCESEITDNESTPKYCLVIASLATLEQAEKYIYLHENDVKGMFESDGRYRVYALTGPDQASVLSQELSERFPGAWPCKLNQ